jgi:hypothetical protein
VAHSGRAATTAGTESGSAAAARSRTQYAVAVRAEFSPETLRATLTHREGDAISAPANPSCTVPVGEQTRDAYTALVRRMFRGPAPDAAPEAELRVSINAAELELRSGGWRAVVEHTVSLYGSSGSSEVARWIVRAEEPILGRDEQSMIGAFARAVEAAAQKIELGLSTSPPSGWARAAPAEPPAPIREDVPALGGPVAFLNFGLGVVTGSDGRDGGIFARGGVIADLLLVQVAGGLWSTSFAPSSPNPDLNFFPVVLDTAALGLELGGAFRRRGWDVRLGGGAHLLRGHANQTYLDRSGPGAAQVETSFAFMRIVPSIFGSVQYAGDLAAGRLRLYLGLEARAYFGTTVHFAEYGRSASIAENSLLLFAGVELPWRWRPGASRGAAK